MKKTIIIIVILSFLNTISQSLALTNKKIVLPGEKLTITGQEQETIIEKTKVFGQKSHPAIVKFSPQEYDKGLLNTKDTIKISNNSLIYLPSSVETVTIEPKVYSKENLSKEVANHYTINYPLFTLVMAAAFFLGPDL